MGGSRNNSSGSNEPPTLELANIYIISFDPPKIKFWIPSWNEFEYDHLEKIFVFLNTHKKKKRGSGS